jgi:uncharacterized protein (DUF1800 family)
MSTRALQRFAFLLFGLAALTIPSSGEARPRSNKGDRIVLRDGPAVTVSGTLASGPRKVKGAKKEVSLHLITVKQQKKKRRKKGKTPPARSSSIILCLEGCDPLQPSSYTPSLLQRGASLTVQGTKLKGGMIYANSISVDGSSDTPSFGSPLDQKDASRFLHQATFGTSREEIDSLSTIGFQQWIDQQMAATPCQTAPRVEELRVRNNDRIWPIHFLDAWWKCALFGHDQLRQRVAYALSQIFVVSFNSAALENEPVGISSYYDMLVRNAFSNYRTLLEDVTLHPAMGGYLSSLRNAKADPANNRYPDENYAREVMQLFSIGLVKLNQNGTLQVTDQGLPIRTYDQDAIRGFARVFTGWTWWQDVPADQREFWHWPQDDTPYFHPMVEVEEYHSPEEKQLIDGVTLPAGQTARQDLKQALDLLFNHPNVGPFISRRLIQRLVHSNPSPDYTARVAAVFNNNGAGVRGDLGAVVKAILLDPEARLPEVAAQPWYGKMREPIIALANLLRTFKAKSPNDEYIFWGLDSAHSLNQAPLSSPTVFNFYEPDYVYPGVLAAAGLYLPEFQLANVTSLIGRASSFSVWVLWWRFELEFDFSSEETIARDPDALINHIDLLMTGGSSSPEVKGFISAAIAALKNEDAEERIKRVLQLIMLSPEFVVQQ